jgi:hypothetical protein
MRWNLDDGASSAPPVTHFKIRHIGHHVPCKSKCFKRGWRLRRGVRWFCRTLEDGAKVTYSAAPVISKRKKTPQARACGVFSLLQNALVLHLASGQFRLELVVVLGCQFYGARRRVAHRSTVERTNGISTGCVVLFFDILHSLRVCNVEDIHFEG